MNRILGLMMFLAITSGLELAQAACPSGTHAVGAVEGKDRCALRGKYLSADLTLTAENEYILDGGVFFGGDNKENSTLRIQAGTVIRGMPGAFLNIHRGSKIFAEGTAARPIVFTSLKTANRNRGEWSGLVLNGNAPINACKPGVAVCEAVSEGIKIEPVYFGGNNPEDNSGVLRYVRVEFAGYPVSQDNELNGITFNAVGRGTTIEFIQVHMNSDDGIEFFGGTAQAKFVVLTANEDDSLDWDMGWTGKIQFMVVHQGDDSADNGIEADNSVSPMDASPRSNPEISNATFIGGAHKSSYGALLRRGTAALIQNAIFTGFQKACIDIDDAETFRFGGVASGNSVMATGLRLSNTLLSCKKNFEEENGDAWSLRAWFLAQDGNKEADARLNGWIPALNSPALGTGVTPDDLFFDPVDFIGAIGSSQDDWTAGWIIRDLN